MDKKLYKKYKNEVENAVTEVIDKYYIETYNIDKEYLRKKCLEKVSEQIKMFNVINGNMYVFVYNISRIEILKIYEEIEKDKRRKKINKKKKKYNIKNKEKNKMKQENKKELKVDIKKEELKKEINKEYIKKKELKEKEGLKEINELKEKLKQLKIDNKELERKIKKG